MTTEIRALFYTTLLGTLLALSTMPVESQVPPPPPAQAAESDKPKESEEERKKKKKRQEQQQAREREQELAEEQKRKQQRPQVRQQEQLRQQQAQERQQENNARQSEAQEREQQERQLQQKRVSQQEQQERIRKQEQQLALYRKNIALQEQLAERDAQILRQQNRLQHLRFQQQYEERLRAQRSQLTRARYDYSNDPFYYTAPTHQYRRDGRYYKTSQYGIKKLEQALQTGYNEGLRAGRADREDRWRYDYRSAFAYQDANYGYDGRYVAQDEYNHYFREGFQRGYDDGYHSRQKYGRRNDNGGINDEWLIAGGVIAAILGYQLLTD